MSSDDSHNAPAASDRRDAVREKAQLVQAKQKRQRALRIGVLGTAVLAVVAVAAVVVTWTISSDASKPELSPANVADDGFAVAAVTGVGGVAADAGTEVGTDGEAAESTPTPTPSATEQAVDDSVVDIRVYVDYLSEGSREFQLANVQKLSEWVSEGAVSLTYHPVAMLTAKSNGTKYSLRAAAASACVATHSPDTFFAFNDALLRKQPAVDSDGFSDTELADLAQASGATPPKIVRACIEDQDYTGWVKTVTERALQGLPDTDDLALTSTPMVLVNGTPYVGALDDPQEFSQFVLTVASDAYYKATPTPTPTPTP